MQDIEGGCLCGAIRFRIQGQPGESGLCHCATCRKAHSAAVVAWLTIRRAQLQLLRGAAAGFSSSRLVVRKFCAICGSPLFYENASEPDSIDVATLALDGPDSFPPTMEAWLAHKVVWQEPIAGLQHFERGSKS